MKIYIRQALKSQFEHFSLADIYSVKSTQKALLDFSWWAMPAIFFVYWSSVYYPEIQFYKDTIDEATGSNLLNAFGSVAILVFGIAVIFSGVPKLALLAKNILNASFTIGSLTIGVLIGQYLILVFATEMSSWMTIGFSVVGGIALVTVFLINLTLRYLSFLIYNEGKDKTPFLLKLEQMHFLWRLIIGGYFIVTPINFFLNAT